MIIFTTYCNTKIRKTVETVIQMMLPLFPTVETVGYVCGVHFLIISSAEDIGTPPKAPCNSAEGFNTTLKAPCNSAEGFNITLKAPAILRKVSI